MKEQAQEGPGRSRNRVVVTAIIQLVSAVVASVAAWLLWTRANNQEASLGAGFWGFVALASFCSTTGVLNFAMPLVRSTFRTSHPKRRRLRQPLSSSSGNWEVTRELFGLGLAFLAPAAPLAMMTLRMYQADVNLTILGVGATLVCVVLGGLLVAISATQLYTMFVAGETIVEIEREPLEPDETTRLFVSYEPGRLIPHRIEVLVLCNRTRNKHLLPNKERRWGSRRPKTVELYRAVIHVEDMPRNARWPWQYDGTLTIPHTAHPSNTDNRLFDIDWSIEVHVGFRHTPDVQLVYPLRVA